MVELVCGPDRLAEREIARQAAELVRVQPTIPEALGQVTPGADLPPRQSGLAELAGINLQQLGGLRLRLLGLVSAQPRSARELADLTGRQPNRLYHHLTQLEESGLIEVTEYRRVAGGKVARVYAPTAAEPPGDAASPAERARFLSAVLEVTRADITAASQAEEAGERRNIDLIRSVIRVSERRLAELNARIEDFILAAEDNPDDDGTWTTVLWVAVDRQDRPVPSSPTPATRSRPRKPGDKE